MRRTAHHAVVQVAALIGFIAAQDAVDVLAPVEVDRTFVRPKGGRRVVWLGAVQLRLWRYLISTAIAVHHH